MKRKVQWKLIKVLMALVLLFVFLRFCYLLTVTAIFFQGCFMDDGLFKAVLIDPIEISDSAQVYSISRNGQLIVENRTDSLSPIIMLLENDEVKWTLDTDLRNTKGYEFNEIWEIRNVEVVKDRRKIKLNFIGDWTMGSEAGYMKINRKTDENCFCLS